jgi:hypothetical protein
MLQVSSRPLLRCDDDTSLLLPNLPLRGEKGGDEDAMATSGDIEIYE